MLLSPMHAFSGPNPSVFGASWAASHRLLLLPPPELARRLKEVLTRHYDALHCARHSAYLAAGHHAASKPVTSPSALTAVLVFVRACLSPVMSCLQVDIAAVPPHNIDALLKYLAHKEWPLPGAPVGTSRHLGRISEWVCAVVNYNQVQ